MINHQGVHLAVATLNCCIKDPEAVCDSLKAMRSICSVESCDDSLSSLLEPSLGACMDNNYIATIVMAISSYPNHPRLCSHGCRALEWLLKAGEHKTAKAMLDEGVVAICSDLLKNTNDLECLRYVCGLVGKICRYTCVDCMRM